MSINRDPENSERNARPDDDEDGGLVSRWSRRKARIRADEAGSETELADSASVPIEVEPAVPGRMVTETADVVPADTSDKPLLTDVDMPDIEDLNDASDFSPFMSPGVTDALRKRAMARLFRLPVFGIRDGLDDYDEDFRAFLPLGDIVTSDMKFQKRHLEEKAREAREALEQASESALAQEDDVATDNQADAAPEVAEVPAHADEAPALEQQGSGTRSVAHTDNNSLADPQEHGEDDIGDAEDDMA